VISHRAHGRRCSSRVVDPGPHLLLRVDPALWARGWRWWVPDRVGDREVPCWRSPFPAATVPYPSEIRLSQDDLLPRVPPGGKSAGPRGGGDRSGRTFV